MKITKILYYKNLALYSSRIALICTSFFDTRDSPKFCLTPAVVPVLLGMGLQKLHEWIGFCVRFTKLSFRKPFSYCAMVILLLYFEMLSSL